VTAWSALARAAEGPTSVLVELAASDLGGDMPLPGRVAHARRARAERLGEEPGAGQALAEILLLEEGLQEERLRRWHSAASAYAQALDHDPTSLEALDGLRRISSAVRNRRGQAMALLRIAGQLHADGRAADLCTQAGRLYEEEGLADEAANAYLEVLRRLPTHEEAYRRLRRILLRREQPAALERLLSFKIAHTADPGARVLLYTERAALRLGQLGKRAEAVHDHRRILALDPDRVSSLRLLARLAMAEDRFDLTVEYLTRALNRPGNPPEETTAMQLDLASAFEADKRPADAERVLRAAIERQIDDQVARERLVALALRTRRFELAAEQLRVLQALTEGRSAKAALAVRLAKLEREERKDIPAALAALRAALQLDPLGEVIPELVITVGEASLSPEDAGAINSVISDLRRTLETDPLQLRQLECLRDLAALRSLPDLHAAASQLLTAMGVGSSRGRVRDLQRPVSLAALGGGPSGTEAPALALMREVWPHVAKGVARLFAPLPSDLGITRQTRLSPGSDPRLAWAENASLALGIHSLSIYLPPLEDLWVAGLEVPDSALALGRGVVGGDPVSRFRVGRTLALLRECATCLDRMSQADLELVWAAAAYLASPRWMENTRSRLDLENVRQTAKKLAKGLSRRELKNLESYANAFEQAQLDVVAWREGVLRTANRFALLMSGDLAVALRALTQRTVPSRQDLLSPSCLDVIHFAFSDRYASVRREAGLSRE
jgi:tetratricopeptide (TPR) repeat protein